MNRSTFWCGVVLSLTSIGRCEAQADAAQVSPQMQARQQQMDALINTPFDFYGKVVDQSGNAVAGATAKVTVMGEVGKAQDAVHEIQSEADGTFSLKGIRAYGVDAVVTKSDYHNLSDKNPPGGWSHSLQPNGIAFPTQQNPAIFILQKKAQGEPLVVLRSRGMTVPADGTAVEFNLEKGANAKSGAFQVQEWVDAHDPKSNQPYHWKFQITVPGGGLQLRDEHQFTGPSSGYQATDAVDMAPGNANWNDVCERQYFVQLPGGNYGRVSLSINAHGSFQVEGYVNPSGSQNLEFDPSKRIKAHAQ